MPRSRARLGAACVALATALGGCSFASDALWPSLSGNEPASSQAQPAAAPAGQAAPTRVEIPPSAAERAAQPAPVASAPVSSTPVGQRIARMREDVQRLQSSVAANSQAVQRLRSETVQTSQGYYTLVGGINARLQVGSTPGNPVLQGQWQQASQELDRIGAEIGNMTTLSNQVSADAALAAFLLDSVRAAYSLSGAVEEDHRQLAALEDEVNRTVVSIDRMLNELSEDVSRQSAYVSRERSNMSALSVAIKNGELFGSGLGNRAFSALAPTDGAAQPGAASTRSAAATADRRPLVVIRFDRPNPSYEQALYTAVSRALERKPQAHFDIVAVAPGKGSQAQVALANSNAKKQADQVVRSLANMGLPADRVKLSSRTSSSIQSNEVQLYVR